MTHMIWLIYDMVWFIWILWFIYYYNLELFILIIIIISIISYHIKFLFYSNSLFWFQFQLHKSIQQFRVQNSSSKTQIHHSWSTTPSHCGKLWTLWIIDLLWSPLVSKIAGSLPGNLIHCDSWQPWQCPVYLIPAYTFYGLIWVIKYIGILYTYPFH